jgi:hypothetical protein
MNPKFKIAKLTDRELQLVEHSLESFEDGFFVAPELQKEIRVLKDKIRLIRFPAPKSHKNEVSFQTMDGSWRTFKLRKKQL